MSHPFHFASALGCALTLCLPVTADVHADPAASPTAARPRLASSTFSVSALARRHWRAIAQGDVTTLMGDYTPEAVFHWKEGAFEGDHRGTEAIRAVWSKFARARAPLVLAVDNVQEKGRGQGVHIVTADVNFRNADWTYPLTYRLVFRDDKIIEETWQLAEPDADPVLVGV